MKHITDKKEKELLDQLESLLPHLSEECMFNLAVMVEVEQGRRIDEAEAYLTRDDRFEPTDVVDDDSAD